MNHENDNDHRNKEGKSVANQDLTQKVSVRQAVLTPPPFQLAPSNPIQEKSENESEKKPSYLQKEYANGSGDKPPNNNKPFQLKPENSSTTTLPSNIAGKMEAGMGQDFSNVKFHKNSQSSVDVGAKAFAQGNEIHFAPGQYDPNTKEGQELIGHELAHVGQQREGRVRPTTDVNGIAVNDDKSLENEADQMGQKAAQLKADPQSLGQNKKDTSMIPTQTIQRWEWPWESGNDEGKQNGDDTKKTEEVEKLKTVNQAGTRKGTNFNSDVSIPGPEPAMGNMGVTLNIKINYLDCDMTNIKKHAVFDTANFKTLSKQINAAKKIDPALLTWDKASKEKFEKDYQDSVTNVWSSSASKLLFKLNEKEYEKYQVNNNIKLNFTDKDAHETINTIKMLPTMGRLRSYRGGEDLFDSRDVSENEKRNTVITHLAEQIGEFDTGASSLNASVTGKISQFVTKATKIMKDHEKDPVAPKWSVSLRGRASSQGSASINKKISKARSEAVEADIKTKLPSVATTSRGSGELNTDKDTKYQRVEAVLLDGNEREISQNVAAHETGHMFGLGDEYSDETTDGALKKSTGDEADGTSQAIRDAGMGESVVEEHRVNQHNDSIMNGGSVVSRGHYSFFLIELKKIATDSVTGAEVGWQVVNA